MNRKRTTLKDIAESLNISTTTVYRALNGHPDISQKLKEQILFLAEQLHYHPNFFASSLRKKHSGMIGVVIPKIIHYFSSTILSGIIKTARERSYQVIICETHNQPDEEQKNISHLTNSGVDGILIAVSNGTTNEDHLIKLVEENIPFVFFDKVPDDINGPKVLTNDYKGAYLATEHLIKQGYKRIAHIKGQQGSRNSLPRFNAYKDALAKYKYEFCDQLLKECKSATEEEGYKFANDFLKMKNRPDAYFAVNDETAIGVIMALRKHNVKIPEEVGVVGFCNSKVAAYMHPSLSSVEQYGYDIGKLSTDILLDMIKNNVDEKLMSKKVILEPKLVVRESSKRV